MAIRGSVIFLAVVNACLILLLAAVWTAHTVRSYLIRKAAEERFLGGYNFPYPTFKFFPRGKKQCVDAVARVAAADAARRGPADAVSRTRSRFLLREASMGTIRAFFLAVLVRGCPWHTLAPRSGAERGPELTAGCPGNVSAAAPVAVCGDHRRAMLRLPLVVHALHSRQPARPEDVPPPAPKMPHQDLGHHHTPRVRPRAPSLALRLCVSPHPPFPCP